MSATRMFRNALAWSGSVGGARVTLGLSSVGPPPSLRMSQLQDDRVTVQRDRGPEHRAVELTGPVLVSDDQEVGEHEPGGRGRELSVCHGKPPSRLILPAGIAADPARGRLDSGGLVKLCG